MTKRIQRISTIDMSRNDWLAARKKGIGGSDAGAILGMNRYRSAYDVYADKLDLSEDMPDNEAMRQGRDLEEYVARRFSEETEKRVRKENAILYNPKYPFAIANIDRAIVGERAGLECKTASVLSMGRYKNGEFPDEYYVQCMHYLMVTGFDKWYLAVLIYGKEFKIFEIERDNEEIKALAEAERSFWDNYILKRTPPPPSGTSSTDDTINSLYPEDDDSETDLSILKPELARLIEVKCFIKRYEAEKKALEQKIKIFMGRSSYGSSDICTVRWKPYAKTTYDTKGIIEEFVPEGTDISKYIKITKSRRFELKEEI